MRELWGDEASVLRFFAYLCPRLYDLNALAYWILEKQAHSEQFLANLQHVTQVVVELSISDGRPALVLRKSDGRASAEIGIPKHLSVTDGKAEFVPEAREEQEMAILSEVSGAIAASLVLEKVFERVMEILARGLGLRRGTLVLLDRGSKELRIVAAHGLSKQELERGKYRVGEGITGAVVQTNSPIAVADINKDPRFLDRTRARTKDKSDRPVSFICVPLRIEDEILGAMSVDRDFVDDETLSTDVRLLQIVDSMIAQAIKINRMAMVDREQLREENLRLRSRLESRFRFTNIVGASSAMEDVLDTAEAVAKTSACVLIYGETGAGKELIANAIHYNSPRANGPFVRVSCSALAEGVLESELFGHTRGAFTGAIEDRKGRFELASGGTIFLDEVGTMPERLQVKLLRVLEEREFEPVGSSNTIKVDIRIIAATNMDLEEEVRKGRFREDIFYRLNVVPLRLPPLRERCEDIPLLVEHFLEKYNQKHKKSVYKISREVLDLLTEYPWPGNVRELQNCIERAVVLSKTDTIPLELLPPNVRLFKKAVSIDVSGNADDILRAVVARLRQPRRGASQPTYSDFMQMAEKALIEEVLASTEHVQSRAARELGMSRNTLHKKIQEYHIDTPP
jgi:Nif-specific regulatory protein